MIRTLYVNEITPLPATTGGRQRSYHTVRALRALGPVEIAVVHTDPPEPRQVALTQEHIGPVHYIPVERTSAACLDTLRWKPEQVGPAPDPEVRARLAGIHRSGRFDLIVVRLASLAEAIGAAEIGPSVVDVDDVEWHLQETLASTVPFWSSARRKALRRAALLRWRMQAGLKRFGRVIVANRLDAAAIGRPDAHWVPNIPMPPEGGWLDPGALGIKGRLLTVGTWSWAPNLRGLAWFLSRCWPRVRARVPHATLDVAGILPGGGIAEAWRAVPGVRLLGMVDDLRPRYAEASACIAPVQFGGGTKIKVLEALAHGRACVATTHAHQGHAHSLKGGEHLLVAADAHGFADACVRLLQDGALRSSLAQRGCETVRREYSPDAFASAMRRALHGAL